MKTVADHIPKLALRDVMRLSLCKGMLSQALDDVMLVLEVSVTEMTPKHHEALRAALTNLSAAGLVAGEVAGTLVDGGPPNVTKTKATVDVLRAEMIAAVAKRGY